MAKISLCKKSEKKLEKQFAQIRHLLPHFQWIATENHACWNIYIDIALIYIQWQNWFWACVSALSVLAVVRHETRSQDLPANMFWLLKDLYAVLLPGGSTILKTLLFDGS